MLREGERTRLKWREGLTSSRKDAEGGREGKVKVERGATSLRKDAEGGQG